MFNHSYLYEWQRSNNEQAEVQKGKVPTFLDSGASNTMFVSSSDVPAQLGLKAAG
jgi:hypothetical protein